jgi:hypothetical protein
MPLCDGRFGGIGITVDCPDNKNDASVLFRHCELFLCEACFESRFPPEKATSTAASAASSAVSSDNADTNVDSVDNLSEDCVEQAVTTPESKWVRSELLCFVSDKAGVMAADHIVEIVHKFYREDEILAARKILVDAGLRLPKRQGGNKMSATVEDIVKAVLNPKVNLPEFHATQLSRLPPVDIKHCDTAAILLELQSLRCEVRQISQLQAEVVALRAETRQVSTLQSELSLYRAEIPTLRAAIHDVANLQLTIRTECQSETVRLLSGMESLSDQVSAVSKRQAVAESQSNNCVNPTFTLPPAAPAVPPTEAVIIAPLAPASTTPAAVAVTAVPTAASIVSAAVKTGALQQVTKRAPKFAVGSSQRSKLQSARMLKPVSIFVSRLDTDTSCADIVTNIIDAVHDVLDLRVASSNIRCEKLKTKFDSYASFSATVMVDEAVKDKVIRLLMSSEGWPEGVLVRKFFHNKQNG